MANRLNRLTHSRLGFVCILLALLWAKTMYAYFTDFNGLGAENILQYVIMIVNPIGASLLLLSIALYMKKPRAVLITGLVIYVLLSILLLANALYYREFTDFLTINTMLSVGKVSQGLGSSSANMFQPRDLVLILDMIIFVIIMTVSAIKNVIAYLNHNKMQWPTFGLHIDDQPKSHLPAATTIAGLAIFMVTLAVSELNRPQLISRTFDRTYIVKYLGLTPFTVFDGLESAQSSQVKTAADSSDMEKVLKYVQTNYSAPNAAYYGVAKGKNVIIIHLESFQQFLINKKIDGQAVTPFLNSLVKETDTLSFSNFFNQVGGGKTSDAENMMETGLFGLSSGSLFANAGSDNTFQAAPAILNQTANYSSAVLHGGLGSFWNRTDTYKSLGYQYFFDNNYFKHSTEDNTQFGIKDKLMLGESAKYLEHMQQPFYSKIITTSNHYPFNISAEDSSFPDAGTDDATVNDYFKTANYLDSALKEFFAYLKKSGLYDNSMVVMYGDHYGISDDRNKTLAPLLGKKASAWTSFDDVQMQRVPLIIHMKGLKGGVNTTYGGEVDFLPTLLHLLGVNTKKYVQIGTDLLSDNHSQVVAFRNHNFITPEYTVLNGKYYTNSTGELTDVDPATKQLLESDQDRVTTQLKLSDSVGSKNLLRFYTPAGFTPVNTANYDYTTSLSSMLDTEAVLGAKSTSLYTKNGSKTTSVLYKSDAPELLTEPNVITDYPSAVSEQAGITTKAKQKSNK